MSESWVRRVKQECREFNKIAPCLKRRRTPLWAAVADRMREVVRENPDLTLRELKTELRTDLSVQTLCTALHKLRLITKKVLIASERKRPDVAERREELRREQPHLNPDRLVFIDETWAKTNMTRPRGRAPKGLTAPLVVDGAINGELFLGWVRLHLVPTLRQGDIVVMDNLGADTVAGVREAITAVGARVF